MSTQIEVYSAKELKEQFPEGYDKVLKRWKEDWSEVFWQDEIIESMKATFEYANIELKDWSLGAYSPCYVKFNIPTYWSELADCDMLVDYYEGKKAYKWLKESFDLKSYRRVIYKNHKGGYSHRFDFQKLDGSDWSCEFTSYCADHEFLESLFDDIHDGMTLKDAFHNLADKCGKLIEDEADYQHSEEYFLETSEANEWQYTKDGRQI